MDRSQGCMLDSKNIGNRHGHLMIHELIGANWGKFSEVGQWQRQRQEPAAKEGDRGHSKEDSVYSVPNKPATHKGSISFQLGHAIGCLKIALLAWLFQL